MGHQDTGHALLGQLLDGVQHLIDRLRVERGRHFVEQHDVRVHGERAGNRHALLLAAGEFAGIALLLAFETDLLDQAEGPLLDLLLVLLQNMNRRHHDVLQRRLVREQVVLLEHHANLLPEFQLIESRIVDLLALDLDRALLDVVQGVDAADQSRLAGARGADDADALALHDVHGNAFQHLQVAEGLVQVLDRDHGLVGRPVGGRGGVIHVRSLLRS